MRRRLIAPVLVLLAGLALLAPTVAASPRHDYTAIYYAVKHHLQNGKRLAGPNIRRVGIDGRPARAADYRRATKRLRRAYDRHRPFAAVAASWYGPGFYGRHLGCGGTLQPGQLGVANKTLPCWSKVELRHRGHTITVPVIDRGPYAGGRTFDLTEATANRLGWRNPAPIYWRSAR